MSSLVLLTGGTGTLGRLVAPLLRRNGATVRVLSRRPRSALGGETGGGGTGAEKDRLEFVTGDLDTGEGIEAAVAGAETIVHCAGSAKGDEAETRTLVRAASRAGAGHLVFVSVVGADRVPVTSRIDRAMFGYFAAKRAAERVVAESGIPWTTLRATQFHDLVLTVLDMLAKLPVVPTWSGVRFQPIDAQDVAVRLAELAFAPPAGLVPEVAGPRVYPMEDLARSYLRARDKRRPVLPIRIPGQAARAFRNGANIAPANAVQGRTWEEFLAERVG